jgi:hypothetical protein
MFTWETFQTTYRSASPEIKAVIDSELIPICVHNLEKNQQIDRSHYRDVVKLYSLFILNAIDENTMVEEMKKIGIPDSRVVFYNLQICREKTPLTFASYDEPTDEPVDLSADIAEAEAVLNTTQPIRTMANDMQTNKTHPENIYSSTQNAILNEYRQKSSGNVPRWGNTDQ